MLKLIVDFMLKDMGIEGQIKIMWQMKSAFVIHSFTKNFVIRVIKSREIFHLENL